jgi:putative tricarboxylic transport membrane protein
MAQQGRAGEAIGVAATASALGAIFGVIVLLLLLPVSREIVLLFGAPEFFWLAIFGLSIIAVTSENLIKGLVAGGFGLMVSFIGYTNLTGEIRWGFGSQYLWDGVDLIIALLGLFAIAGMMRMMTQGGSISREHTTISYASVIRGVKHTVYRPLLLMRSSVIGLLVGMVPGVGGTVATFISYGQAVQTSDDPKSFGKGNPDGVLAGEAANDSKDGGALLPLILFGIPGGSSQAVLLGGLVLHGLTPGRQMLNEGLPLLTILIVGLLFANIYTSTIGVILSRSLIKVTNIPVTYLIPILLVTVSVGAFALNRNVLDIFTVMIFGMIGYLFVVYDYPRISVVLGIILGPIAEVGFHQSLMISGGNVFYLVSKPVSIILVTIIVLSLSLPVLQQHLRGDSV